MRYFQGLWCLPILGRALYLNQDLPSSEMPEESTASIEMKHLLGWAPKVQLAAGTSEGEPNFSKRQARAGGQRVAMFVAGLQDRLIMTSKLDNVIVPLAEQGHEVDVFIQLVASGDQNGNAFKEIPGVVLGPNSHIENLCEVMSGKIELAGGTLAHCILNKHSENVMPDVHRALQRGLKRFEHKWGYPLNTTVGQNVVRRLYALEQLMHTSLKVGKYDRVLVTRDDDYWLSPLNLKEFPENPSRRVFTKDCKDWWGVNDKTFLFDGEAARLILLKVYTDFWINDKRLETMNAETFWKAFIELKGAASTPVHFRALPTTDAMYQRPRQGAPGELCLKEFYLCDKSLLSPKLPHICKDSNPLRIRQP